MRKLEVGHLPLQYLYVSSSLVGETHDIYIFTSMWNSYIFILSFDCQHIKANMCELFLVLREGWRKVGFRGGRGGEGLRHLQRAVGVGRTRPALSGGRLSVP